VLHIRAGLVEVDCRLELDLRLRCPAKVEQNQSKRVVVLGVVGVELQGLLERCHAERQPVLAQVSHGLLVGGPGPKLGHFLVLLGHASEQEHERRGGQERGTHAAQP
jgi:hypothetical protein